MGALAGRVALVTGAASGIGRATAVRFAAEGAAVAALDVQADALAALVDEIEAGGGAASRLVVDVSDPRAAREAVEQTVARHGRLDVLCNIAGVGKQRYDEDETPEGWARIISINLTGTFFMCQAALPHLYESRGSIVNTASTAGTDGTPWCSAYAASKAGVIGLTKSLAVSHGKRGVRVNCIAPGPVRTPIAHDFLPPEGYDPTLLPRMLPFDRIGEPEELASCFLFLASDEASYVNGEVLKVDAGARC